MTRRRWLHRPAVAIVVAAGLVGVPSSLAAASQPCPSSGAAITVTDVTGAQRSLSADEICAASDVLDTQYFTKATPTGDETPVPVQQGLSMPGLLADLGIDPDTVSFIAIPRSDGTWSTLSNPADFANPSDFRDGLLPVFRVTSNGIDYLRPLRSDSDVNSNDYFQTAPDGSFDVQLHSGSLLSVTASADRTTTKTGTPVKFTAAVDSPPHSSQPLRYSWVFGDGSADTGVRTSHAYTDTGGFDAQVTVRGADGSAGVSDVVQIIIPPKTPPTSSTPTPTPDPTKHPHPPTHDPTKGPGHHAGPTPSPHPSSSDGASLTPPGGSSPPGATITIPPLPDDAGASEPLDAPPVLADGTTDVSGLLLNGEGITLSASEVSTLTAPVPPAAYARIDANLGAGFAALGLLSIFLGAGALRQLASNDRRSARLSGP